MKFRLSLLFFLGLSSITLAQSPNDCEFAIVICGDSSLEIEPDGIGFDEFSLPGNDVPTCYTFDHNTTWFKFEIVTSGAFTFDLVPDNGIDDYDFAIFGPNVTCTTLGSAIRCSSTNPQDAGVPADTGLNMEETDTEEGPGPDGNGYLKYIDAVAGDVYYLLVDRAVGSGPFSLFYTGSATLPISVVANPVEDLITCDTDGVPDGFTAFNLEQQTSTIIGSQTDVSVTYHISLSDASIGLDPLLSPYINITNPQTIYARLERNNGCADITTFNIEIGSPILFNPDDVILCSYNASETYILDTIIPEIINDPQGYVFSYHYSNNDAINNSSPIGNTINFTETPTTVYVRVTDENDPLCFSVTYFQGYINRIKLATKPEDIISCDDDLDGQITINLSEKDIEILNGLPAQNFEIYYYTSEVDRLNETNAISGNFRNTESPQTIYSTLLETATGCFDFTEFNIIVNPLPIPLFENAPYYFCLNTEDPITISVQSGFQYYVWSTGEEGANLNAITINEPGNYTVFVTDTEGCEQSVSTEVLPSNIATIIEIKIIDFSGINNSIEIIVDGPGDYEYALDNDFHFQDSNIFTGILNGYHTVYVRDKNGCGVISQQILMLDYPRFFTPNNDGYHDYWHIIGMDKFPESKIYIFDRFGKLLKEIEPTSEGWNGTNLKGNPLPSNDYWFTIDMKDRPQYKGHFTLKR